MDQAAYFADVDGQRWLLPLPRHSPWMHCAVSSAVLLNGAVMFNRDSDTLRACPTCFDKSSDPPAARGAMDTDEDPFDNEWGEWCGLCGLLSDTYWTFDWWMDAGLDGVWWPTVGEDTIDVMCIKCQYDVGLLPLPKRPKKKK